MSWTNEAIGYLLKHSDYVVRDLESLRSGKVKVTEGENDVSDTWARRLEREMGHLDKIIKNYEAAN